MDGSVFIKKGGKDFFCLNASSWSWMMTMNVLNLLIWFLATDAHAGSASHDCRMKTLTNGKRNRITAWINLTRVPPTILYHSSSFWPSQWNQQSSRWAYTSTASALCHPSIWWVKAGAHTHTFHHHTWMLPLLTLYLEVIWTSTAVSVLEEARKDRCSRFVRLPWINSD